jgi:hypothetical protein
MGPVPRPWVVVQISTVASLPLSFSGIVSSIVNTKDTWRIVVIGDYYCISSSPLTKLVVTMSTTMVKAVNPIRERLNLCRLRMLRHGKLDII